MDEQSKAESINNFSELTGLPRDSAIALLEEHNWDFNAAASQYFDNNGTMAGAGTFDSDDELAAPASGPASSSGRRLGDASSSSQPVPSSSASGANSSAVGSKNQPKKKFASLRDFESGASSHDHDDDSDQDQEYFAGGDKSGLAVQEPGSSHNQHIQRLLDRARRNGPPPARDDNQQSNFSGQGQTLGSDEVDSRIIPDPNADARRPPPMVERTLHIWDDGFSIDDGPLHRYDDPANRRTLEMINRGSAPLDLMNVEPGQAVDVRLDQHRGESYVTPKKVYKAFSGGGQRLGSPVPGASSSTSATASSAAPISSGSTSVSAIEVDDSQPTITLQIRLADGTRMPSRFNATHSIGDVYNFVSRANAESSQRPYTLATTFPTKDLMDKDQVLGDMAEFKRGGVIVQKWQ